MKNKLNLTIGALMICLALVSIVSAFGLGSPYYDGYEFEMAAGETRVLNFNLQNKAGATEDVTARIWLIRGNEIASLEKEEYLIKAGERLDVPLKIKIPLDAKQKDKFSITITTKTISPGDTEGIAMGIGMTSTLNVTVSGKIEKKFPVVALVILIGVVALAIVLLALKKKDKKRKAK